MVRSTAIRKTLVCEAVVFGLLIALVWMNELLDLPHSVFGAARTPTNWTECLVESFVIVFLAVLALISSYVLLARIRYLEGFLHVCRHCRKIHVRGKWVPLDSYMMSSYEGAASSGGLCPDCTEKVRGAEASPRAEREAKDTDSPPQS